MSAALRGQIPLLKSFHTKRSWTRIFDFFFFSLRSHITIPLDLLVIAGSVLGAVSSAVRAPNSDLMLGDRAHLPAMDEQVVG